MSRSNGWTGEDGDEGKRTRRRTLVKAEGRGGGSCLSVAVVAIDAVFVGVISVNREE